LGVAAAAAGAVASVLELLSVFEPFSPFVPLSVFADVLSVFDFEPDSELDVEAESAPGDPDSELDLPPDAESLSLDEPSSFTSGSEYF
jgi:hypothetical protein